MTSMSDKRFFDVGTFDSKELQAIVSRAIRSSALESFIRLLTLENLDTTLPDELKRLESAKTMTQAKYRFLVHRRTMQLQALLSSSLTPSNAKDDDGMHASTKLVVQLSETVAECDLVMEELVKLTDQITQVKKLVDHHWASALAIALRKVSSPDRLPFSTFRLTKPIPPFSPLPQCPYQMN